MRLLDAMAADAASRGDRAEAMNLLNRATSVGPYDDERYLILARTALAAGRRRLAAEALRRGSAARAALGLPPFPELEEFRP